MLLKFPCEAQKLSQKQHFFFVKKKFLFPESSPIQCNVPTFSPTVTKDSKCHNNDDWGFAYDLSYKSNLTIFELYKSIARQLMTSKSSCKSKTKRFPLQGPVTHILAKVTANILTESKSRKCTGSGGLPPRETAMKNATRLWRQLARKQTAGRSWLAGRTRGFTLVAISEKAMMTTSWRRPTRCTRCTTTSPAWSARWSEGWGGRESRAMGRNA